MHQEFGTKEIQGGGGFGFAEDSEVANYNTMKDRILERVKGIFNPEFLNRLDETIVYHALTKDHVLNGWKFILNKTQKQQLKLKKHTQMYLMYYSSFLMKVC